MSSIRIEVEISKIKNMRGRITAYRASLGTFVVDGKTEKEARENLANMIARYAADDRAPTYLAGFAGEPNTYMISVHYPDGWGYEIVRPLNVEGRPNFARVSGCSVAANGHDDCLSTMQSHYYAVTIEPFVDMLVSLAKLAPPIGCKHCQLWASMKHERRLPVAGDTYCAECGAREADVSADVRRRNHHV